MTALRPLAPTALALAAALATTLAAGSAHAVDFGGYFRAGPGATKKDASRACYGLNGPGLKYRLGNECDFYGEFLLSHTGKVDEVEYKAHLMTNLYNGGTDTEDEKVGINQMYVEGKGFDIAPNTSFWIGKRFYQRADVHIVDTFYTNLSGVGAGADGIVDIAGGKLNFAFFRTDNDNRPGSRLNLTLAGLDVNPGGKLTAVGTFTKGHFSATPASPFVPFDPGTPTTPETPSRPAVAAEAAGTNGFGLSLQHTQAIGATATNNLWLQYAQGSAGLDGNFGDLNAPSAARGMRIVESFNWQAGPFGGQAQAMFQQDKAEGGAKTDSATVGGRVSYAMSKHLKLLAEAAYSQKKPDGSATQKLSKLTVGPALSTGPGFFNRPELRLYVTSAKWNQAANAAAGSGGVTGIGDGKTSGTSFGAQVEVWF
ncbi:carbohydrate porin [Piscinibacter gummiphilus]|uniref:Carbohydrate porin n=1 Tax=Piscinibacter gummiphilus TaxID=946333 RepID=A0ABZ0CS32_9BURK|nr:carbohydrate porin [Piscinibacter gummiphilus]WOB07805.1 carbohydrate porin [Piscinibacter gummiphilus]